MFLFSCRKILGSMLILLAVSGGGVPAARAEPTAYLATDLVSDQPGVAPILDPQLINAWGIALSPTGGAFWVSSEVVGVSTLYAGDVPGGGPLAKLALEVSIPGGHPTGTVFNPTSDFVVFSGSASGPAFFIFASLTGAVTGWNPAVPPPTPSTSAQLGFQATDNAIYTGIALANSGIGNFLYLADFHNRKIDVLDASFHLVFLAGSFTDPDLPADYAPFNVAAIGGKLYAAYAKQNASADEEVAGPQLGFVDVFDLNGNLEKRLVSQGDLNAPWAMVLAPAGFGDFSGALLVGNFGDGRINAYDPATGVHLGTLSESPKQPIQIDGLWGLAFGNGATAGSPTTLYFAAGPDDEKHGLFGKITANPAGTNPVHAALTGGDLVITGSPNDDRIDLDLGRSQLIVVTSDNQQIGTFDPASVSTVRVHGWGGDDRIRVGKGIGVLTILEGGAGNDILNGGGGNAILLGGPGNDDLVGSGRRDILIGGAGLDRLRGGSDDDLLIGGTTAHDNNIAALLQILAEWTSTDDYATRIDKLRNGTGGLPKLDTTTVVDDGAVDTLFGNQGLDWFFTGLGDQLPDRLSAEQVN
jgi:uncharacterized protein (TIGR03118 family)